jgi:hypothetical protein
MAFSLPSFNITVAVYSGPWLGGSFRFESLANYAFGRRVGVGVLGPADPTHQALTFESLLLLPPGTDIRSGMCADSPDVVEIPVGSGRWYMVFAVDVIGMGFPNEHVGAAVVQISARSSPSSFPGLVWPVPMT